MKIPTISDALFALGIDGGWKGKDGAITKWWATKTQPSDKDIQDKLTDLKKQYSDNKYQRDRQAEYPSITNVVVALAEKEEGRSAMWDEITAQRLDVKSKYPKP